MVQIERDHFHDHDHDQSCVGSCLGGIGSSPTNGGRVPYTIG
jgi:hypothetical protein